MPKQNRVTRFGKIVACPERGMMMGNRGILHDASGSIRRPYQVKRWLICRLEFRGRHRTIMAPNRYTELFFLDEATGLAAGHRPCAECQRRRYDEFRAACAVGNLHDQSTRPLTAAEIDERLHADRLDATRSKRTFTAHLDDLPDGVFVTSRARKDQALLIQGDSLLVWFASGYRERLHRRKGEAVSVLTPAFTVATIRAGFSPQIHPSAILA
jgi:methylphosphotriester-DNA--protein-cysteine methyltransferase